MTRYRFVRTDKGWAVYVAEACLREFPSLLEAENYVTRELAAEEAEAS